MKKEVKEKIIKLAEKVFYYNNLIATLNQIAINRKSPITFSSLIKELESDRNKIEKQMEIILIKSNV